MKKIILYAFLGAATLLSSCDSFLDKLPDSRTQVNNEDKVTSLLISAYPDQDFLLMPEFASDNIADNGKEKNIWYQITSEVYKFDEIFTSDNIAGDLWNGCYSAAAAANQALQAIDDLGNPESLNPQKAEALLCRAYSHFILANIFCMPYSSSSTDLGLPYADKPETEVQVLYKRGTLVELYDRINKDIEEALPLVDDAIYKVPKYHFNEKAAYAFASRFNLYYQKYDKVIEYANKVLGNDALLVLRDWNTYKPYFGSVTDFRNHYISEADAANLLLQPTYSTAGRLTSSGKRFRHNMSLVSNETFWAKGPWGTGGSGGWLLTPLFGSNEVVYFPKILELFEYTDKASGTGFAHVVVPAFTTDETLLCRAEAYIMKKQYNQALVDLNSWLTVRCKPEEGGKKLPLFTIKSINDFYEGLDYAPVVITNDAERSIKKKLNPVGFTVEAGQQENFIQCLLHLRRIETLHEGLRWYDLKRYGIEFSHSYETLDDIVILKDDPRRAFQLPQDVIQAGLQANPR